MYTLKLVWGRSEINDTPLNHQGILHPFVLTPTV